MTATPSISVTHTGRNTDDSADRVEIRSAAWEAVVHVTDGMWPSVTLVRFIHTCGGETPTTAERGRIRRAAIKWAKNGR